MSRFKNIVFSWGLLLPVVTGCRQAVTQLRAEQIRGTGLYEPVLSDTCVPAGINGISVYRTRFEERFVESGSVLRIASLNTNSRRPAAAYKTLIGYRQELYLVHVATACQPDAWVYFSVLYRPDTHRPELVQEGFGQAYLGEANPGNGTIYFSRALSVGYDPAQGRYFLQKRRRTAFFFVADSLAGDPEELAVNRIVIEEKNKFAGPNPFVFVVRERFGGELDRLRFKRLKP